MLKINISIKIEPYFFDTDKMSTGPNYPHLTGWGSIGRVRGPR